MSRYLSVAVISYLLGSIPFAFIAARLWSGVDIRTVGSRNVGTTNVFKHIGPLPGLFTAVGDAGKGIAAVLAAEWFEVAGGIMPLVALIFAVIGHNWSIWLHFDGGGGLATSIGGLFHISPPSAVCTLVLWALTYRITGHKYVSSVGACAALPVLLALFVGSWSYIWGGFALAMLLAVKQIAAWSRWAAGRAGGAHA